ncbi:MAG: hypothetical protein Q8N90_02020 [bacterium]|nr:hypothetical protein [bacterium]
MENFEQSYNNKKPKKPEFYGPNWYQDFEVLNKDTGTFKAHEASGEERIIYPPRPPIIKKCEEAERRQAGVAKLIDQLPKDVRIKVKEKARIEAVEEIQKKQHILTPVQAGEGFLALVSKKEWEMAAKWLENNPEKKQKSAA